MTICPVCRQEIHSGDMAGSGRCLVCDAAAAGWQFADAADVAAKLCGGRRLQLAVWWQGVARHEYVADAGGKVGEFGGAVAGGLLLGPLGRVIGGEILGGGDTTITTLSARLGIVAIEDEATWVIECEGPLLGESERVEDQHILTTLKGWESGSLAPETTRIPAAQVSCHSNADGLVLKYDARTWTMQLCGAPFVNGQPELDAVVKAIMGGVQVPSLQEFMQRMIAAGVETRLLDAVAADPAFMQQVLAKLARMGWEDLAKFLTNAAGAASGFRLLIGAWVLERSEGVERRTRSTGICLAIGAVAVAAALLGHPVRNTGFSVGALVGVPVALVTLPLAAVWGIKARTGAWFQTKLPQFGLRPATSVMGITVR